LRESLIALAERVQRYGQVPVTVLLVGLTGSGKSRIAYGAEKCFSGVARQTGRALDALVSQPWLWKRRLVFVYDDSSVTMPDTPQYSVGKGGIMSYPAGNLCGGVKEWASSYSE
jgi:hypothetical protein